jgi:hypothetical protein
MFAKPIASYFAKDLSDREIEVSDTTDQNHYLDNSEE